MAIEQPWAQTGLLQAKESLSSSSQFIRHACTTLTNSSSECHKHAALIHKAFVCHDVNVLLRVYLVYVRPLLEFNSVIWSPHTVKDITAIESVQCRFTKQLAGFNTLCYRDRLQCLSIPGLELRRLQADLVWCYKTVFSMANSLMEPTSSHQRAQI